MYLFFEEGHLHPACISNRSPGMRLQAGFDAAPDLILCVPYLATSSTKGWMYFLNSSLVKVEGALDPSCKSRRSGTKLRSHGSSKAAASLQIPEVRTSEKQKHKVNEMKSASSYRRAISVSEEDIPKAMVGCAALINLPTPNKFAN